MGPGHGQLHHSNLDVPQSFSYIPLLPPCSCLRCGSLVSTWLVGRPIFKQSSILPVFAANSRFLVVVGVSIFGRCAFISASRSTSDLTSSLKPCLQAGCTIFTDQLWRVVRRCSTSTISVSPIFTVGLRESCYFFFVQRTETAHC